jgi:hypothetical protein
LGAKFRRRLGQRIPSSPNIVRSHRRLARLRHSSV